LIEFVTGDFFDYDADIRINTVNCVGVMGAGVALEFKKKYPEMFKEYVKVCKKKEIAPGKPYVWEESDLFSRCVIVNLPTKIHWRNSSEYEYIELDLIWLHDFLDVEDKKNAIVTLPALGCGHGGLNWNIVKGMICHHLKEIDAKILVFEPSSSNKNLNDELYLHDIVGKNIRVIYPFDKLYPQSVKETFINELYCKGNIDLLAYPKVSMVMSNEIDDKEKAAILQILKGLYHKNYVYILPFNNKKQGEFAKLLLDKGYRLILVIPYGILNIKNEIDYQKYYDSLAIISYLKPRQDAKRYEYINSLKFRLELADAILYCNDDIDSLRKGYKYIRKYDNMFYVNFWTENIEEFYKMNAKKIGISAKTKKPNLEVIESYLDGEQ